MLRTKPNSPNSQPKINTTPGKCRQNIDLTKGNHFSPLFHRNLRYFFPKNLISATFPKCITLFHRLIWTLFILFNRRFLLFVIFLIWKKNLFYPKKSFKIRLSFKFCFEYFILPLNKRLTRQNNPNFNSSFYFFLVLAHFCSYFIWCKFKSHEAILLLSVYQ